MKFYKETHSPPAPTPKMPREMASIHNKPFGDVPLDPADIPAPKSIRRVAKRTPDLRLMRSINPPKNRLPIIIPTKYACEIRVFISGVSESG